MNENFPINQNQYDDTTQNVVPDLNDLLDQQNTDLENIPSTNTNPPDNNDDLIQNAILSQTSKMTGIPDYTKMSGPVPVQPYYDTKQGNVPYDTLYGEPTNQLIDDEKPTQEVETPDTSYEEDIKKPVPNNPYEVNKNNMYNPITGSAPINESKVDKEVSDIAQPKRSWIFGGVTDALIHGESLDTKHLSQASYVESTIAGIVEGAIKILPGVAYGAAHLLDWFGEKGIPLEESHVAKLTEWINSKPTLAKIMKVANTADIAAKETGIGELAKGATEILGSVLLVSGVAAAGELVLGAAGIGTEALAATALSRNLVNAAYSGRLVTAEGAALEGEALTKALNAKAGLQKYTSLLIKGGTTGFIDGALVADVEDIGTFGSIIGGPTALDEQPRKFADEEASRYFINRLKFMGEGALLGGLIPIAFTRAFKGGVEKVGAETLAQQEKALTQINAAIKQGQDLAENQSKLDNFLDRERVHNDDQFDNKIVGC